MESFYGWDDRFGPALSWKTDDLFEVNIFFFLSVIFGYCTICGFNFCYRFSVLSWLFSLFAFEYSGFFFSHSHVFPLNVFVHYYLASTWCSTHVCGLQRTCPYWAAQCCEITSRGETARPSSLRQCWALWPTLCGYFLCNVQIFTVILGDFGSWIQWGASCH